ncbi:hypothetical protein [Leifsonia sp. TF02-11]|uniref:hypothetical protein n=1 Tax=Leifsonia sp. TF02-11 TaxID=2815212 RepID=UPI001AA142D3|nr:hypothetical protein [Leifsonia sp. TF02-11]MBO1741106.1 hypothetical protein [Leifsonia sp. TF02-11]
MDREQRSVPSPSRRRPSATVIIRAGWTGVLVVTAVFHVVRGAPVDAAIYAVGAVVLVFDALGWLRIPLRMPADRDTVSRRVVAYALIAVASLTLGFTRLYGMADTAIVVGLGILLLPVGWADRGEGPRRPPSAAVRRAAVLWSIVIVAGCLWEIGAFFLGRDLTGSETAFPALSDLIDPLLAWPPARALLVACWLLGGYALLRRGRRT